MAKSGAFGDRRSPYLGFLNCQGECFRAGGLLLAALGPGLASAWPVGGPPVWNDVSRGELPPHVDEAWRQSCTAAMVGQSDAEVLLLWATSLKARATT